VAGIVTASATSADISFSSENIDQLALALVTPLGSEPVERLAFLPLSSKRVVCGVAGDRILGW
jgi:hypothetical protein